LIFSLTNFVSIVAIVFTFHTLSSVILKVLTFS